MDYFGITLVTSKFIYWKKLAVKIGFSSRQLLAETFSFLFWSYEVSLSPVQSNRE